MATKNSLIGMQFIGEILETALHTGMLTDAIPISVVLIGPPGAGKSKIVLRYDGEMLYKADDLTTSGLFSVLTMDRENKVTHFVVGDFNPVVSHKKAVSSLLIASLLAVMSDGTVRIADGREGKEVKHNPCGLVTAVTREVFNSVSKKWDHLGFKRRFLPIYYDYSAETKTKIQQSIQRGDTTLEQTTPVVVKQAKEKSPVVIPERVATQLNLLANMYAENLAWHPSFERDPKSWNLSVTSASGPAPLPFTPHLILRTMARGHAMRSNRRTVTQADYDFTLKMVNFTKYSAPVQL